MDENEAKVHYYSGKEQLKLNGKNLKYTMIDFWRMKLSSITETMTRGSFAEFLVACALEEYGVHALRQDKVGVDAWDLDGPEIKTTDGIRESRIEVKSTANIHINLPEEERELPPSRLTFSIREAAHENLGKGRHSDLYVFCYYKATKKAGSAQTILDLDYWDFYVLPTRRITADETIKKQHTISIARLHQLGLAPVSFEQLYNAILDALKTVGEVRRCTNR